MSRRVARQVAFQTLFQIDVGNCDVEEALQQRLADAVLDEANEQYVNEVVRGVYAYRAALDAQINDVSTGWRADRIGAVERSILRLAIYEIVFRDDVPVPVSVNEAVELAKRFGDDDAPRFINGVLGTVVRDGGFA
ncbi:MAG: transcription antitermination factor NusB [Firmicutes bacterium]|nr:transcription antitermination factor NusB [Bacillota bacterium]